MSESPFFHPHSLVEPGATVGAGSRVWAFAHVLPRAVIGENCNICDHVFIENDVRIGNNVTIKCGVQIWDGITIEDNAFIGPNVTFTNDAFPRSKEYPEKFLRTLIRERASIGANATILPGLTVGRNAMIGSGSVVTRDVPPNAMVMGNPAQITGYVGNLSYTNLRKEKKSTEAPPSLAPLSVPTCSIPGVSVLQMPVLTDLRGSLSFGEYNRHLPFEVQRFFVIYDVPSREVRGEHAHKTLHQVLVCLKGSCSIVLDNGSLRDELDLNTPAIGLHLPPMVWAIQYRFTQDAVLLVLASDKYDADDYIRDYDTFLSMIRGA